MTMTRNLGGLSPIMCGTLATDFSLHPLHEPSNCRLVPDQTHGEIADLLQFDGQHKTTAQIILGRAAVPMKVYVDPNAAMIQELVVQIQQGIKKRPLSTSDTLRKLDDVVNDKVAAFRAANNDRFPTEPELVAAQPRQDHTAFKKRLLANFDYAVYSDPAFTLHDYTSSKANRNKPFTDTVLINKMIRPLISQDLISEPLNDALQRDCERGVVIRLLNQIGELMLVGKWSPQAKAESEDLHTRRARNFFYQAAISWWLGDILIPAIGLVIPKARWKRMFVEPLTDDQEERIDAFLEILCSWPVWSTQDGEQLAALRSNTVANVAKAFADYDQTRLIRESQQ